MEWFTKGFEGIMMVILATTTVYATLILFTRAAGLRSFSKISSFDFATTIAMGSIIATTVVAKDPPIFQGIVALGAIFVLQFIVAKLRHDTKLGSKLFNNNPILLMNGEDFLEDNMHQMRVTREDILSKLRESNVFSLSEVRAVVMETTGDISVLHAKDSRELDPEMLRGVRDEHTKQSAATRFWSVRRASRPADTL